MSLNRCEQRVFDYWQSHRDERQFWQEKVRAFAKSSADDHVAAGRLDGLLVRKTELSSRIEALNA
jgi:hypothetical protein